VGKRLGGEKARRGGEGGERFSAMKNERENRNKIMNAKNNKM
jgi:hypothetical protein